MKCTIFLSSTPSDSFRILRGQECEASHSLCVDCSCLLFPSVHHFHEEQYPCWTSPQGATKTVDKFRRVSVDRVAILNLHIRSVILCSYVEWRVRLCGAMMVCLLWLNENGRFPEDVMEVQGHVGVQKQHVRRGSNAHALTRNRGKGLYPHDGMCAPASTLGDKKHVTYLRGANHFGWWNRTLSKGAR